MSNYPTWWDTTITVYNQYTDVTTRVVRWYRTVLYNCFWKEVGSKVEINGVVLDTLSTTCRIPSNRNFMEAHQWVLLPNDIMATKFTLQQGDIIIKGEVLDDIDEYHAGHRKTDLIQKYRVQGCIEIKDIALNEMAGILTPHYRVKGV